jgi:hypothetical protein
MFETYYSRLMEMKKGEIIREGMTWGIWANSQTNYNALMKWTKVLLARKLADRLVRLENRGY